MLLDTKMKVIVPDLERKLNRTATPDKSRFLTDGQKDDKFNRLEGELS